MSGFFWAFWNNNGALETKILIETRVILKKQFNITTLLCDHIFHFLKNQISNFPQYSSWFEGLIMGDRNFLFLEKTLFDDLGIIHLLVISGMHFSTLSLLGAIALLTPIRMLYALKLLNPIYFTVLSRMMLLIVIYLAFFYSVMLSFPASVQRSFLVFFVNHISFFLPVFYLRKKSFLLCLGLQILVFPKNFLSLGNMLSWLCYICVCFFSKKEFTVISTYQNQLILSLVGGCFFQKISVISLLVNPFCIFLFSITYGFSIILVFLFDYLPSWFIRLGIFSQELFFKFLQICHMFFLKNSNLILKWDSFSLLSLIVIVFTSLLFLIFIKELTIDSKK